MKRILFLLLFPVVGCCSDKQSKPEKPQTVVGKYQTKELKVFKKTELHVGRYSTLNQVVYLGTDGSPTLPYAIPGRYDGSWWDNLEVGEHYKVLIEDKKEGSYIWDYHRIDR